MTEAGKMKTIEQVEPRIAISKLPFEITMSGSYYLTGPLEGAENQPGITIRASHVRLDFRGFPITGYSNTLDGIWVPEPCRNIAIRNGIFVGWGGFGVNATNAEDIVLTDCKACHNGLGGFYVGDNAHVERCSAYGNGITNVPPQDPPLDEGIRVGAFSTVTGCKARGNGGAGIHALSNARITECTAMESPKADGIHVEDSCTVRDSTASRNGHSGIRVGHRCRVLRNTCAENGVQAPQTNAFGIVVVGSWNIIEDNCVLGNDIGVRLASGVEGNLVIRNLAGKNSIDYDILGQGNFIGPIEPLLSPSFTNTNPWTNFKMGGTVPPP